MTNILRPSDRQVEIDSRPRLGSNPRASSGNIMSGRKGRPARGGRNERRLSPTVDDGPRSAGLNRLRGKALVNRRRLGGGAARSSDAIEPDECGAVVHVCGLLTSNMLVRASAPIRAH